jgi:MraZ protein
LGTFCLGHCLSFLPVDVEVAMKFARPFLSTFVNKVDAKGRVSVPARFRDILEAQGARVLYARASTSGPAIVAGGLAWMEQLHAEVAAHDPSSEVHDDFAYALLGDTVELGLDGEGRVGFPDELMRHAGLDGAAAFVGMGSYFEIWEPRSLEARKVQARRATVERRGQLRLPSREGGK